MLQLLRLKQLEAEQEGGMKDYWLALGVVTVGVMSALAVAKQGYDQSQPPIGQIVKPIVKQTPK